MRRSSVWIVMTLGALGCSASAPQQPPAGSESAAVASEALKVGGGPIIGVPIVGGGPIIADAASCSVADLTWLTPSGQGKWQFKDPTQAVCAGGFQYVEYVKGRQSTDCHPVCDTAPGGVSTNPACSLCPVASYNKDAACPANCAMPNFGGTNIGMVGQELSELGGALKGGAVGGYNWPGVNTSIYGDHYTHTQVTSGSCFDSMTAYVSNRYDGSYPLGNAAANWGIPPENCAGCGNPGSAFPTPVAYLTTHTNTRSVCSKPKPELPPICRDVTTTSPTGCMAIFPNVTVYNTFSVVSGVAPSNPCPLDQNNKTCNGTPASWQECNLDQTDGCGTTPVDYTQTNMTEADFYTAHQGAYGGWQHGVAADTTYFPDLSTTAVDPAASTAATPLNPGLPARICGQPDTYQNPIGAPCITPPSNAANQPTGLPAICVTREEEPLDPTYSLPVAADTFTTSSPVATAGGSAQLAQQKFNDLLFSPAAYPPSATLWPGGFGPISGPYASAIPTSYGYAKLLFELQGELLTTDQQATAWKLYMINDYQAACDGAAWAPAAAPAASCFPATSPSGLDYPTYLRRVLNVCNILGANYASQGVATAFANQCFALAKQIPADSPTDSTCNFAAYRSEWEIVSQTLLSKLFKGLYLAPVTAVPGSNQPPVGVDAGLQQQLGFLESWYEGEKSLVPPAAGTQAWNACAPGVEPCLANDTLAVVSQLWGVLNTQANAALNVAVQCVNDNDSDPACASLKTGIDPNDVATIFTDATLNVDLQLLSAIFTPVGTTKVYPLHSAPLLYLLGDALQAVSNHLQYGGLVHDVACQLMSPVSGTNAASGCANGAVRSDTDEMWGLIATMADASTLATQTGSTYAGQVRPSWSYVFRSMQTSHAATLEAAAIDAYGAPAYTPAMLDAVTMTTTASSPPWAAVGSVVPSLATSLPNTVPSPAQGIVQVVQAAAGFANNYAKTGLFTQNATNTLNVNLQSSTLATGSAVDTAFNRLNGQLSGLAANYIAGQSTILNTIKNEAATEALADDTNSQISYDNQQAAIYHDQITGLQTTEKANVKAYGDFAAAFNKVTAGGSVNGQALVNTQTYSTTVSAASATAGTTVDTLAVHPTGTGWNGANFIPVTKGMILNVNTSGSWYPTCALQWAQIPDPANPGTNLSMSGNAGAVSYGNGYYVNLSQQSSSSATQASSFAVANADNYSLSASASACTEISYGSGIIGDVTGLSGKTTLSACLNASAGVSGSRTSTSTGSTTNGTNGALTASFSAGITLPGTPFPTVPAGALLLVQTDVHGNVIDATVAQPGNMSLLIDQPGSIYLVDNDQPSTAFQPCDFNPAALTVSINALTPQADLFKNIAAGMATALTDIKAVESQLIQQGQLLPSDVASMTLKANADLSAALVAPYTPANIPASLSALFNEWLDVEVTHVERQVQIAYLTNQLNLIAIQLGQYQGDLNGALQQLRFDQILVAQAYANMSASAFAPTVTQLLTMLSQDFYPAAFLKDEGTSPPFLPTFTSSNQAALNALINLDWAAITPQEVQSVSTLLTSFEAGFQTAFGQAPNPETDVTVALAFPNPDYLSTPIAAKIPPSWMQADPVSSQAVWNAINAAGTPGASTVATVTINPAELYRALTVYNMTLPCVKVAPIVDQMVFWFGLQGGDSSYTTYSKSSDGLGDRLGGNLQMPIAIHSDMSFALQSGLVPYEYTGGTGTGTSTALSGAYINLFAGTETAAFEAAKTAFATPNTYSVGQGLSAFQTFDVDLGGLGTLYKSQMASETPDGNGVFPAVDLVLMMQLETTTGQNLSWVDDCVSGAVN